MTDKTKEQLLEEIQILKKQISDQSSKNEDNLKSLFNAMKDIVFEMDYDGKYINIAPTSPDLMYKLPKDAIGKTLHEVFPKDIADNFLGFIRKTIDENKSNTIEYPLVIGNNTVWFEGSATPKTSNSIFYIARDITKKKQAEEKYIAANQQLEASNQQLQSSEQQLKASNQQLAATNQQLRASDQVIRESEDKYKKLFEYAPIGIATIGINGNPISMNQHILDILGSPSLEASKQINVLTFKNLIDSGFTKDFIECIKNENIIKNETNYISNWNIKKRVRYILSPMYDSNKDLTTIHIIFEDITEQNKIKKSLREKTVMLDNILKSAVNMAIATTDLDFKITYFNPIAEKFFGYSANDVIGKTVHDLHVMENVEDFRLNKAIEIVHNTGEYYYNVEQKTKDGIRHLSSRVTSILDSENNIIGYALFSTNITKQIQSNQALLDSEKSFHSIVDNAVEAIYILDKNGVFIDVNKGVIKMYGYEKDELIGNTPAILSAPNKNDMQMVANCLNEAYNGKPQRFEFWGRKKNGDIFPKIVKLTNGYYFGEKTVFAFAIDITEEKKTEDYLRHQNEKHIKLNNEYKVANKNLTEAKEKAEESDRLKTAFLQNISHEIRTPMNGILGFTSLLKTEHNTPEEQQSYVDMIMTSGKRMLSTINDLIDISKLETGQVDLLISPTNINELLSSLYNFFTPEAQAIGLQFTHNTALSDTEANIYTDNKKLSAILTNIIKNALKYTNNGTVEFGYKIKTDSKSKKIEFYVKDTGIGIIKNRQKAIFERFIQAEVEEVKVYEGAGLGLSISKAYIDMIGGEIWVESVLGQGSTFYFTIPYNQIQNTSNVNKSDANTISKTKPNKLKILIVEDEKIADAFLTAAIKNISKEVLHVGTGKDAINICKNTPDIDLILMDIKMPVMNGYEATKLIRQFNENVIIIAQTAFALPGDRRKAIDVGCNDYISKPIDKDKLMEIIDRLI